MSDILSKTDKPSQRKFYSFSRSNKMLNIGLHFMQPPFCYINSHKNHLKAASRVRAFAKL